MELLSRERVEQEEHSRLSARAAFADETRGRERPIEPDPWRTEFQRDRDRIIHCKAFRRLAHKTQVFLAPRGDHYRTRLTHTLEVSQIARSVARTLRLNEDLTEAIALGHDLGHTPFGHIGEDGLDEAFAEYRDDYPGLPERFRHNEQSLRVVERLEYEGKGLNLTWEVRDGILHHTGSEKAATLEGQIVALADRIAYINHDIDDAVRGGILDESDLPESTHEVLGPHHGARITTLVQDMVQASEGKDEIQLSRPVWDAMMELRTFLFENVYLASDAKVEDPKAKRLVKDLFRHFMENPSELPRPVAPDDPELPRLVADYIAGMTDRFAISTYEEIYVPSTWSEL
ncbi:MAG: deoxyguanosinetriphosphate triphosphohydrolase [Coriobacteriia bacterium]